MFKDKNAEEFYCHSTPWRTDKCFFIAIEVRTTRRKKSCFHEESVKVYRSSYDLLEINLDNIVTNVWCHRCHRAYSVLDEKAARYGVVMIPVFRKVFATMNEQQPSTIFGLNFLQEMKGDTGDTEITGAYDPEQQLWITEGSVKALPTTIPTWPRRRTQGGRDTITVGDVELDYD